MLQNGKESASPSVKEGSRESSGRGWLGTHWCAISLCVIVIAALLLRTVFAYGISADGNFALSGGTGAQYHLHVIESILNGSYAIGADSAVNYPVGGLNVNPPLVDFIAAGIASFTSPSAALGGLNPVLGALTCIPVYFIAREMFGDKVIGVISALVLAFLPLPIASTVFSNGNEYALAAFLVAFMSLFLVRAAKALDAEDGGRSAIINGAVAGIFLGLCALTWNGFGVLVAVVAAVLLLQLAVRRFSDKDMRLPFMAYGIALILGLVIAAVYYIPAGLWDAVFSGPCLLTVLALVFAAAFMALAGKSWVIVIPALFVAFLVVMAALFFAAPALFDDLVGGNTIYNSLLGGLVGNRVSMSNVSAYYGWLTMWLPICLAIYETYVFIRKDRSSLRLFAAVWLYMMFFAVWSSYATAAAVACVFAVGSGAAIVKLIRYAKVGQWLKDLRANGFSKGVRKALSPFPLASALIVALLVIVPNFVYALDAGVPVNDSDNVLYNGNTQYFIQTGDDYPIAEIWDSQDGKAKDGAIATWIDYTYDSVSSGGFDSVTDTAGNGTSAVSHMLLSEGSAGAIASMIMRIVSSDNIDRFASDFTDSSVYEGIKKYSTDCDALYAELRNNASEYGKLVSDVDCENALYFASVKLMTDKMSVTDLCRTYDKVCATSGDRISYILLDPEMLPIQYGSQDHFSTMAYLADYATDSYGAVPQFYSFNTYYGYTNYTDSMYDTFLWKAFIGPSASDAGVSSSYSYLYALSSSDGTIAAAPAGMAGFDIDKWIVRYSPVKNPEESDWTYMDHDDAVQKQKKDGGIINYLSSYMLYKYVGVTGASAVEGRVVSSAGDNMDGLVAELYVHDDVTGKQVLASTDTVRNGKYSVAVPSGEDEYTVVLKSGSVELASFRNTVPMVYAVPTVSVDGSVAVDGTPLEGQELKLVFDSASLKDVKYETSTSDGNFHLSDVIEGEYSVKVYGPSSSVATSDVVLVSGQGTDVSGLVVTPTTRTITVTLKDPQGASLLNGTVIATETTSGMTFSAPVEDGKAVVKALPGTYTLQMTDGYALTSSTTYNISSSNRTATLTAHPAVDVEVGVDGLTFSAGTFSTVSYDGKVSLPRSIGTDKMLYTVYGMDGGQVVLGTFDGALTIAKYPAARVTGVIKTGEDAASGTVYFVNGQKQTVTATAGSDGKFTAIVPIDSYQVFANDGSSHMKAMTLSLTGDKDLGDVVLDQGRRVTANFRYASGTSSGNIGLGYVTSTATFTKDTTSYTMYSMTTASGQSVFIVPTDVTTSYAFNDGSLDNGCFYGTDLRTPVPAGTSSTSANVTIPLYSETPGQSYVKHVSAVSDYDVKLTPYSSTLSEVQLTAGEAKAISPGQYTAKVASNGSYFDGTVHLYPGQTAFVGFEPEAVHAVKITKGGNDILTVDSVGDGAGYYESAGTYYFKDGGVYYLKSTATNAIKYATVDLTDDYAVESLDMTASVSPMTVTGSIGVDAEGDMIVSSGGVSVRAPIENGQYTVALPSTMTSAQFAATAKTSDSEMDYEYAGSRFASGLASGSVVNVAVVGDGRDSVDESLEFTASVESATFANGIGTARVSVTNNSERATTYLITAGSAWSLSKAVGLSVPAGETRAVDVAGVYDAKVYAVGSDGMTVKVSDVSGSGSKTLRITENSAPSVGSKGVVIVKSGERSGETEGALDKVSATEYMYAVTVSNLDDYSKTLKFSVPESAGWDIVVTDESGLVIRECGEPFTLYGLQTEVFYVKYMVEGDGTGVNVPSAKVTVDCDGTAKVLDLVPADIGVKVDSMSAEGDDIYNSRSGMPVGVWFLLAIGLLLLIAAFWLGSKRGVFSRR